MLTVLWLTRVHVTSKPGTKKYHLTKRKGFTTATHQPAIAPLHFLIRDRHSYIPYCFRCIEEQANVCTFLTYVLPVTMSKKDKRDIIRKELSMGVRNKKRETLRRLDSKTLDSRFLNEIKNGLNCSPFEAEAVLEVVKEVYFPFLDEQSVKAPPGKVTLIAVSADEPAGKSVVDCEKQSVCLTIHRGSEAVQVRPGASTGRDDRILQEQGAAGFRQSRILDLCQEALSQGALLTREDPGLPGVLRIPAYDHSGLKCSAPGKPGCDDTITQHHS